MRRLAWTINQPIPPPHHGTAYPEIPKNNFLAWLHFLIKNPAKQIAPKYHEVFEASCGGPICLLFFRGMFSSTLFFSGMLSSNIASKLSLKYLSSIHLPINTILLTFCSSSRHGPASSSSLASMTAWKTFLRGKPLSAKIAFILKILPFSGGSVHMSCIQKLKSRGIISPSFTIENELTHLSCRLLLDTWPCPLVWPEPWAEVWPSSILECARSSTWL
mmetsp:Transcript_24161/g.38561  ORF Transcript_24161/g.38561 Transcript_24161/m.38561 type:complete len:218 (-) Transcript_24161:1081-1734(-)